MPSSLFSSTKEATAIRSLCNAMKSSPCSMKLEKSLCSNKDPAQPKINKFLKLFFKNPRRKIRMKKFWWWKNQSSWGYFGFDAKSKSNKSKNKHWNYRKLKNFCTTKGIGQQNKKVIYGVGENICKLHFWQGLISKILKELIHFNSKSKPTNKLIKKWAEDLKRHFFPVKT